MAELLHTYLEFGTLSKPTPTFDMFSKRSGSISLPAGEYLFDFAVVVLGVRLRLPHGFHARTDMTT